MTLSERLSSIKTNWQKIKAADSQFSIAGAKTHQYNLNPILDNKTISAFEKKYEIELPEEYKKYLLEVSNGGACPFNKMYALQDSLKPLFDSQNEGNANYDKWLSQNSNHFKLDFVVTEEKIVEHLTYRMQHALMKIPLILMDAKAGGYLFLCDKSENSYYILVLNGPCVNEVFVLTINPNDPTNFTIYPEVRFVDNQVKTLTFLEWIEDEQANWFNTNADLDKKLSAVKIMWHNFAAWDKNEAVFGAFMHHYQLNKTLSEDEVSAFEKKYQFALPNDYRQYIKKVNNGGVGPFYGMYSFEDSTIALNSGSIDESTFINHLDKNPNHYSQTFPITDAEVEAYLLEKVKNPQQQPKPIKLPANAGGYLFLAEYGCGGYYIMPINGNSAGEVWYLQKMSGNKLTYEMTDADGNVTMSGSYGDDGDDSHFELHPELKWNNEQASTVDFLEWIEHKQLGWFADLATEEKESEEETAISAISNEDLNNENAYYPLAVGNTWTYKFYNGENMITTIDSMDKEGQFLTSSSLTPLIGTIKKINGEYFCDSYEKGKMQLFLKDNLALGDTWDVNYKANGLDGIYKYTAKEILPSKTVEGKEYKNVMMVELDSYYLINGNLISMNAFTQNYYAKGIGPILTTTSGVIGITSMPLISYTLQKNNIVELKEDVPLQIGRLRGVLPQTFLKKLIENFTKVKEIEQVYVFSQKMGEEISTVLGIELSDASQKYSEAVNLAFQKSLVGEKLDNPILMIVLSNNEGLLQSVKEFENSLFYNKQ
jgi:hypothetical protein